MRSRTFFLQECSPFAMVLVSGSPAAVVLASPTSFRRFGRRSFRGSLPSRCVRRINFRCGRVTANKLIDSARPEALDELPQFWNVLVGDMSVVGPRPALPREVRQYSLRDQLRLAVRPGITCYWQTRRNRDSITFDKWVDLDLLYILKASLWTDIKLIIQTVGCVLTFQGE